MGWGSNNKRSKQQQMTEEIMKKLLLAAVAVGAISSGLGITQAADQLVLDRNAAIAFATLPDGVRFPEGIAADPATGDIFVATFDVGPNPNKLMRFSKNGQLSAIRDFGGTPLLGLDFDAVRGKLYILNFGTSKVQRIAANFDATTAVEDVATFDDSGRLWVAANQGDQIVALNENGRVVAKLGEFHGINRDGTPSGLLFPASPVIVGGWIYVTNLALPLTASPAEWETE